MAEHAVVSGLRRTGSEPQVTQVLASVFQADPVAGGAFVRLVINELDRELAETLPKRLTCSAEEVVADGRLDLRFTSEVQRDRRSAPEGPEWRLSRST